MKSRTLTPLIFAASLLSAPAAVVITGVTATASTTYPDSRINPTFLVNNSGLSVPNDVTATHAGFATSNPGNGWHAGNSDTTAPVVDNQFVTFNLGSAYNLESIYIWQMNQNAMLGRGVNQFDILVSSDGTNFTEVASNLQLTQAANSGPISAQAFALNQSGVTHVRIGIDSAWSGNANDYVGLDEVMFTAVPEPSIALLSGLGVLALLRRRR